MSIVMQGNSGQGTGNGSAANAGVAIKTITAGSTGTQTATAPNPINGVAFTILLNERAAKPATVMKLKGGTTVTTRYKGQTP